MITQAIGGREALHCEEKEMVVSTEYSDSLPLVGLIFQRRCRFTRSHSLVQSFRSPFLPPITTRLNPCKRYPLPATRLAIETDILSFSSDAGEELIREVLRDLW